MGRIGRRGAGHRVLGPGRRQSQEKTGPVGAAQEDLFLRRGRRVYRVAVVTPLAEWTDMAAVRESAFAEVNGLACRLPGASCGSAWWAPRG